MRQVIIYPGEDGYFVAEVPSLPGCMSQGKSKEEAITNIKEAIRVYIAVLQEDNISVPDSISSMLALNSPIESKPKQYHHWPSTSRPK